MFNEYVTSMHYRITYIYDEAIKFMKWFNTNVKSNTVKLFDIMNTIYKFNIEDS